MIYTPKYFMRLRNQLEVIRHEIRHEIQTHMEVQFKWQLIIVRLTPQGSDVSWKSVDWLNEIQMTSGSC